VSSLLSQEDGLVEVFPQISRLKSGRLFLGFSGGLDSTVLLHLLCRRGFSPKVIHVHHGLSPLAAEWALHAKKVADHYGLECEVIRLEGAPSPGESVEAWARQARYRAFEALLTAGSDILFLGHHLDDQAETVLLQLLRGAGPKGLSAMPVEKPCGKGNLLRPLLSVSRENIERYAKAYLVPQGLDWIHDESNDDIRFKRNALRHEVIPILRRHFPGCLSTLARSARLCREQEQVLSEWLDPQLVKLTDTEEGGISRFYFKRNVFSEASPLLKRQLLRRWILSRLSYSVNEKHLTEIEKLLTAEHWSNSMIRLDSVGNTSAHEGKGRIFFLREKNALVLKP
jgi:tRNA(Ile)-lysidine synthase